MIGEMESPGALAGAAGGEQSKTTLEPCPKVTANASAFMEILFRDLVGGGLLVRAALALNTGERIEILDSVRADLLAENEPPFAPDHQAMTWARGWAETASRSERKAYALACFEALERQDQDALLAYIGARAAA